MTGTKLKPPRCWSCGALSMLPTGPGEYKCDCGATYADLPTPLDPYPPTEGARESRYLMRHGTYTRPRRRK